MSSWNWIKRGKNIRLSEQTLTNITGGNKKNVIKE